MLAGGGSPATGEDAGGPGPDPELKRVIEEAQKVFREQAMQDPGCWEDRTRQSVRGKVVDHKLIDQLDQALQDEWLALPSDQQTLWSMNCLVYAGETVLHSP